MQLRNTRTDITKKQALPYKKYLEALVLSGYPGDEILQNLRLLGLTPIPTNIANEMVQISNQSKSSYPDESAYPLYLKKMVAYLQDLPGFPHHMKQCFELLGDVSLRKWVQVMAMANMDPGTIYVFVSSKTEKIYDEIVFADFLTYFFDLKDFTAKDKFDIMSVETDLKVKELYQIALNYDKDELLWRMGFTPDLSIDNIIKGISAETFMRLKTSKDNNEVARLGTLALKCVEKLKEMEAETKQDLERFNELDFDILQHKPEVKLLKDIEDDNEIL